ncbi:MAG: 3-isopropylmalate dehydratase small subunit [Synergistales bacterium]|nr:3-isopropylmalate dehydratase small subunit [Synergistales bacterium]
METTFQGKVWTFGDDVDTDAIIPARYLVTSDETELGSHCMEDALPSFATKVARGDIIVAGENFGCGSSREHAPLAIKGAGVACVVAASFARIFFRNAINVGLPIVECPQAARETEQGQTLEVDVGSGVIRNIHSGATYETAPFPPFLRRLIEQGGLVPYVQQRLKERDPS